MSVYWESTREVTEVISSSMVYTGKLICLFINWGLGLLAALVNIMYEKLRFLNVPQKTAGSGHGFLFSFTPVTGERFTIDSYLLQFYRGENQCNLRSSKPTMGFMSDPKWYELVSQFVYSYSPLLE